jgi:hypothetical protein
LKFLIAEKRSVCRRSFLGDRNFGGRNMDATTRRRVASEKGGVVDGYREVEESMKGVKEKNCLLEMCVG